MTSQLSILSKIICLLSFKNTCQGARKQNSSRVLAQDTETQNKPQFYSCHPTWPPEPAKSDVGAQSQELLTPEHCYVWSKKKKKLANLMLAPELICLYYFHTLKYIFIFYYAIVFALGLLWSFIITCILYSILLYDILIFRNSF